MLDGKVVNNFLRVQASHEYPKGDNCLHRCANQCHWIRLMMPNKVKRNMAFHMKVHQGMSQSDKS